ncbi:FxLD family lanthipeptide [Parasphingorhabdus pacifica]
MTVSTKSELASPEELHDTAADMVAESPAPEDFDLDIRFAESGPVIEELMRPTDDGCGHTCESACTPTCP